MDVVQRGVPGGKNAPKTLLETPETLLETSNATGVIKLRHVSQAI